VAVGRCVAQVQVPMNGRKELSQVINLIIRASKAKSSSTAPSHLVYVCKLYLLQCQTASYEREKNLNND